LLIDHNQKNLQLPPDIFEIVEAFFAGEPFGGADGAFGKAAAGFGVVAEIDAVGGGFEDEFVQADDFAFTEGSDFDVFFLKTALAGGFADHVLERDGCAGGRVFFVGVVTLEDLSGVAVAQGGGGGAGGSKIRSRRRTSGCA
jgi:hypothetical protein